MQGILDEYHHGKRDDNDGYVVLHSLAYHYAISGSTTAAQYQQYRQELNNLIRKHPEFKANPPSEFREQREFRERAKKREGEVAGRAQQEFIPKDSSPIDIYGSAHQAVVQYQHRLDFFEFPESITLRRQRPHSMVEVYDAKANKAVSIRNFVSLGLKPLKVMTFRYPIQVSRSGPAEWRFVWVCDDLIQNYSPSDNDEYEVYGKKYPKGLHWLNESADQREFCGALGVDGKIIYQLPIKQHLPDTLYIVGPTTPDGSTVVISVGEEVEKPWEDGETIRDVGKVRQALIWTAPDKLEIFDIVDAAKVNAVLKAHGFNGEPWPWPWEK